MPELPEVQTIVDDLRSKIIDAEIVDFITDFKKAIKQPFKAYIAKIKNKKILSIDRRGKYLLFELSGGNLMVVHLRMTGNLLVDSGNNIKPSNNNRNYFFKTGDKFIHHRWLLDKKGKKFSLNFSDVRKFAVIWVIDHGCRDSDKSLGSLGVEPLLNSFNLKKIKEILGSKKNLPVRKVLLDQRLIAGLGNIYVSEILHEAMIDPKTKAGDLEGDQTVKLLRSIKKILKKAILHRGTTISDYKDASGNKGGFQRMLKVYGRKELPCKRNLCKGRIQREIVDQRSSFWCPDCQK